MLDANTDETECRNTRYVSVYWKIAPSKQCLITRGPDAWLAKGPQGTAQFIVDRFKNGNQKISGLAFQNGDGNLGSRDKFLFKMRVKSSSRGAKSQKALYAFFRTGHASLFWLSHLLGESSRPLNVLKWAPAAEMVENKRRLAMTLCRVDWNPKEWGTCDSKCSPVPWSEAISLMLWLVQPSWLPLEKA